MKEKIINTATKLFLKIGFKSVNMDDIAQELAISKKTIYTHFKNKTDLIKECALFMFHNISNGIDEICDLDSNPIEELFQIKKFITQKFENSQTSAYFQLNKYYPEISKKIQKNHLEKMLENTCKNMKKGINQGLYRKNLDLDFIGRVYFMGVTGIQNQTLFPIEKFSSKYRSEEYLEYHLRGIVTSKGLATLNKYIKEHQSND